MKTFIQDLKTPRQWWSALGGDAHHFAQLLVVFQRAYEALHEMQLAGRMVIHPTRTHMKDEEDLLFLAASPVWRMMPAPRRGAFLQMEQKKRRGQRLSYSTLLF